MEKHSRDGGRISSVEEEEEDQGRNVCTKVCNNIEDATSATAAAAGESKRKEL